MTEVWRHDGEQLRAFHMVGDSYQQVEQSVVLPGFPLAQAQAIVQLRDKQGEVTLMALLPMQARRTRRGLAFREKCLFLGVFARELNRQTGFAQSRQDAKGRQATQS